MFEFHKDKPRYFNIQHWTARDYIIPFLTSALMEKGKLRVLEIGCAEAGVLKAFVDEGHQCVGIELHDNRLAHAREFLKPALDNGQISFLNKNIYDIDIDRDFSEKFDLIILKDVIEHIPDQQRFIPKLRTFLKDNGVVFFGFPPWYMPFGGHQQVCKSKVLSKLPYFHLLPKFLYKAVLQLFGESDVKINNLMDIRSTGISIERFERIVRQSGFQIKRRKLFLFNPIYKYKFNLKPRYQSEFVERIPFLRNFVSTAAYYIIG